MSTPQKHWLEDYFPFWHGPLFIGDIWICEFFGVVNMNKYIHLTKPDTHCLVVSARLEVPKLVKCWSLRARSQWCGWVVGKVFTGWSIDMCEQKLLTVDGSEIRDQLTSWGKGSLSHYFQGFIHPRWCRISSSNGSDWFYSNIWVCFPAIWRIFGLVKYDLYISPQI